MENSNSLHYAVSTFDIIEEINGRFVPKDIYPVAWYSDLSEAENLMVRPSDPIFERLKLYALIEYIPGGDKYEKLLYQYDKEIKMYQSIASAYLDVNLPAINPLPTKDYDE